MCKSLVSCFFDSQYSCVWNRRVLADCWIYFSERFISKHAVNWALEDPVASRTRFALLSCEMLTSNISDNLHYVRVLEIWWTVTYFYKDMPTVELTTKELRKRMARMPNGVPELPPVGSLHDVGGRQNRPLYIQCESLSSVYELLQIVTDFTARS